LPRGGTVEERGEEGTAGGGDGDAGIVDVRTVFLEP
jgi:hypothetical protein